MPSFEDVEATFWDATIEHGVLPPLTQDMVAVAERELDVKLPDDLLRLLRIQNGGVVDQAWDARPAEPNFYADDHVPFDHVFGLDQPVLPWPRHCWTLHTWCGNGTCRRLVLLSGQGHHRVALDYRTSGPQGEPVVTRIHNEMEHELRRAQLPHLCREPHVIRHLR